MDASAPSTAPAKPKPTALYRYYDRAGALLYVGVAKNPIARLYSHLSGSLWVFEVCTITVEWFPSRAAAFGAETKAIKAEKPKHNCVDVKSPNGDASLHAERTRLGFEARRRAGQVFGRQHSIRAYPRRMEAMAPYIESGEVFTMHPAEALRILNEADPRARKITSAETFRRWRREGFPGYHSAEELAE